MSDQAQFSLVRRLFDAIAQLKELNEDLAEAQGETLARTREREHWHQRTLEAERKLQEMTESRNCWRECYELSSGIGG